MRRGPPGRGMARGPKAAPSVTTQEFLCKAKGALLDSSHPLAPVLPPKTNKKQTKKAKSERYGPPSPSPLANTHKTLFPPFRSPRGLYPPPSGRPESGGPEGQHLGMRRHRSFPPPALEAEPGPQASAGQPPSPARPGAAPE